jgi:choice-of-anchor B domain-containing protein
MQVFDLNRLKDIKLTDAPLTLKSDKDYRKFGNAHNIFINEDTGYAYAVGTSTCDGGLHIINIKNPLNPKFVNCIGRGVYELPSGANKDGNAYTHDVQCVVYSGPDMRFFGKEICVSSNEDTVNIVDVTDKSNPYQISVSTYDAVKYTHQGWLTEDHSYFLLGDELDEKKFDVNTKTFIWDFRDLTSIKHFATHTHATKAIDHNLYIKGNYAYMANYNAGLRVMDIKDIAQGKLHEVAFLDPMPGVDSAVFEGVWSTFPFFDSGVVITSGINGTLYISRPNLIK